MSFFQKADLKGSFREIIDISQWIPIISMSRKLQCSDSPELNFNGPNLDLILFILLHSYKLFIFIKKKTVFLIFIFNLSLFINI